MRPTGGRRIAVGIAAAGVLMLAGAGFSARGLIRELWVIRFELQPDGEPDGEARMRAAIEWLEARRSVRAAPRLLEIAAWEHGHRQFRALAQEDGELTLPGLALRALRDLPIEEDWYLARLRPAGEEREGERLIAIRRLADLGSQKAVPDLEQIAREGGRTGSAAAAALARILPSLTLEEVWLDNRGRRVLLFHLRNQAPAPILVLGFSRNLPIHWWLENRPGGWTRIPVGGWCGSGLQAIELKPGAVEITIATLPQSPYPMRLGIDLLDSPSQARETGSPRKSDYRFENSILSPEIPPDLPATVP